MKPGYSAVAIDIPIGDPKKMEAFQEVMDAHHDEMLKHYDEVATELGISSDYSIVVVYLRGRSRWTQELEDELIRMSKAGEPVPNTCTYGQ